MILALVAVILMIALLLCWPSGKAGETLVDIGTLGGFAPVGAPIDWQRGLPNAHPFGAGNSAETNSDSGTAKQAAANAAPQPTGPASQDDLYMDAIKMSTTPDAALLRWMAGDGLTETLQIGPVAKGRLLSIATKLDSDAAALAGCGDYVADLIASLASAVSKGETYVTSPAMAEIYHAALVAEAIDSNSRVAEAGLAVVDAENDAAEAIKFATAQIGRAGEVIDAQRDYIGCLQRTVIDLCEQVQDSEDELNERPTRIVFAFTNDPAGMGVELASDLALALALASE